MLHLLLYGLLAIFVAVGLFLLAVRFLPAGEQIAPPLRDEPPWELPTEHNLRGADIDAVRLPVALRGYRFAETDTLLDRLARELRERDDEISRLRAHAQPPRPDDGAQPTADPYAPQPPYPLSPPTARQPPTAPTGAVTPAAAPTAAVTPAPWPPATGRPADADVFEAHSADDD